MCERKVWTQQEDELLVSIMRQGQADGAQRLKWNEIATRVSAAGTVRRGKQCRQRWFNQLHPQITREAEWSREQEERLFLLQRQEGNKWARIARRLPGRSDNNIKNYFYSTLRKALRRVNNYVTMHKYLPTYKNLKAFQPNTLNKILTVAENKAGGKVILGKQGALALAKELRDGLIRIQLGKAEEQVMAMHEFMGQIVRNIQDFNRICKRRKSKKKGFSSSENEEGEENSASMPGLAQQRLEQDQGEPLLPQKCVSVIEEGVKGGHELQKKAGSCLQRRKEERPRFEQVESQPINESVKVRLPIIPSLLTSNCLSTSDPTINHSLHTNKESQSLQSQSLSQHFEPAPAHPSNLSFIPYLQSNFFAPSAYPSNFFPAPFISVPNSNNNSNGNNYSGVMNWSEEYACHNNEQSSPFSRACFNVLQSTQPKK